MVHVIAVTIGFIIDMIIGDPNYSFHPIRLIGHLISFFEKLLFKNRSKREQYLSGVLLWFLVVGISFILPFAIIYFSYKINWYFGLVLESILAYQIIAAKSLRYESMRVYYALADGDLEKSRKLLSMIVGRDTEDLDEEGIIKATVETVAENTADGITAPIIYTALFGSAFGIMYKAVNTLDSMVGYKNDKYMYFGRFSAKMDDVFNFIPSRISAVLMILASLMKQYSFKDAIEIFLRDRYKHKSPNAAQTESVVAGALGVQLAGDAFYFGKLVKKPFIGNKTREVKADDIRLANRLSLVSTLICLIIIWAICLLFYLI